MSARIDEIAEQIVALNDVELQALFKRLEELSLSQDLHALSLRYRGRLMGLGEADLSADVLMKKLKLIREEIAARECPG